MKIKPEDRPKMIGLLTAIGIMFCYLILVVVPSLSGAQAAPASQETPGTAPAPPANTPSPVPAPSSSKSGPAMMEAGPVPDTGHDPFLSPTPNPASAAFVSPAVFSAPPVVAGTARPIPVVGTTPPAASKQTALQTVPSVPLPSLMLLGVADGEEQVAVFQVGENTLEKKKGDALPGGFTLQTIDGDGVTLARGKAACRLEVGHTLIGAGPAL